MECSSKYSACVEKYMGYLSAIPLKWAEMIACNICNIMCNGNPSCEEITDCQTLTELSSFTVTDRRVCFSYDDERGIRVRRCFEIPESINGIDDADGTCLTQDWYNLSSSEKWQAIINRLCICCGEECICSTYRLTNQAEYNIVWMYSDCNSVQQSITLAPNVPQEVCACDIQPLDKSPVLIELLDDGTCSTTTTTTGACTCGTYSGYYFAGPSAPSRLVTVRSCDEGNPPLEIGFNPMDTIEFCACYYGDDPLEAILDFNGIENITFLGDGCFATTTTTSTTTTTTETTTTTTTTTTTSSTTTTTTVSVDLCECHSYNILNEGVEGASGSYQSCVFPYNTIGFVLGPGGSLDVCACLDSVVLIGAVTVTITDNGICDGYTSSTTTTTTEHIFDTILQFDASNQDTEEGVVGTVLGANPVIEFHFDAIAMPTGSPQTMEIYVSAILKMVVDFPDEYLGQPFKFIDTTGLQYFDVFTNGSINF